MEPTTAFTASAVDELSARERGVLLGSVLFASEASGRVRGLAAPFAERCLRARRALDARPEHERRRLVQQLVQQLGWPLPDKIEEVPPDEIARLLESWPGSVAAAICALLPRTLQHELGRFALPHQLSPALQHALSAQVLAPLGRREAQRPTARPAPPTLEPPDPAGSGQPRTPRRSPR
ncbi:MAG: hypothetical protein IPL40_12130 [Proteobacteria bacterium]|nr:hypothetical protein [Pseudomonadota bacterium]